MKIIYGPVASWRLKRSHGVDLICSQKKICSFDCIYCQLGNAESITTKRKKFISIEQVKRELDISLKKVTADVITLSGMGEPTLAKNISEAIVTIRNLTNLPIALLTNSSLLYKKDVQKSLKMLDIIIAKLDAPNQELLQKINRPAKGITFKNIINGIKTMKQNFYGKFALQIMFVSENKNYAYQFAKLARKIKPDEVQINTPLRLCAVKPLSRKELEEIEKAFAGLTVLSVYNSPKPITKPLDKIELIKRKRREP